MNMRVPACCAGLALAMGCGVANAQATFQMRVGGDALFEGAYISQDNDAGLRSTEFRNRVRLNFLPSAKADNGLEYGARMRIRASNGDRTTDADRVVLYAAGSFGRVDLGVRNSYNDDVMPSFMRPSDFQPVGITDPGIPGVTAGNATAGTTKLDPLSFGSQPASTATTQGLPIGDISTKFIYTSPKLSGFQAGFSYTPHSASSDTDVNRLQGPTGAGAGTLQDVWEINLNYSGEFDGVAVRVGAGYIGGAYEDSGTTAFEPLRGVQVGGQIGYAGFILGGGYLGYGKSGLAKTAAFKDDYTVWNVGLQYTTGPLILGVGYTWGQDAGDVRFAGNREQDYYTAGVSYQAAPGLRVALEYSFYNFEVQDTNVAPSSRKVDSNIVMARSLLSF